jgi:hypothetical protein
MPGRQFNPVLPLPRQWPERLRCAVVHATARSRGAGNGDGIDPAMDTQVDNWLQSRSSNVFASH